MGHGSREANRRPVSQYTLNSDSRTVTHGEMTYGTQGFITVFTTAHTSTLHYITEVKINLSLSLTLKRRTTYEDVAQ
jgi:uncharacterized protein (UPF0333 family)